ncbi:hypothetical protein E5A76_18570 [Photobacterium sp. CAIM 1937]|nr:hypothetical protein [Vibrio parahaemolyticus]MZG58440.1 hypothetical protein [Photobacterium lucens]MZG79981.1 hypothetical protein [Photobacterium lucens]
MKTLLVLLALLLTGCSSGLQISVPDSYFEQNKATGYLVGSLGANTEWPKTGKNLITTINIRPVDTANSTASNMDDVITITNNNEDGHFENPNVSGHLFSIELPVGEYEIFSIKLEGSDGNKTLTSQNNKDMHVRFEIEPNKASYIGQFLAVSRIAKSDLWNLQYPSGYGYLQHSYDQSRDELLFAEHYPENKAMPFNLALLTFSNNRVLKN